MDDYRKRLNHYQFGDKKKYQLQTIGFFLVKKYNDLRYTFNVPYAKEALAKRMFSRDKFIADYGLSLIHI